MPKRNLCVAVLLAALFFLPVQAYADESALPAQTVPEQQEGAAEGQQDAPADEAWDPAADPASDDGEHPEAETGILAISVKYTSGLAAEQGDAFDVVYQVVGSDAPAKISLNADEINGYVGEVELAEGTYEVIDLQYTGNREDIRSYGIENTFTISADEDAPVCLVIGEDGVFQLAGQEGYFTLIDEADMAKEAPEDADASGDSEDEAEDGSDDGRPEIRKASPYRIVPALIAAVVLAAGVYAAKKKGKLEQ